MLARSVFCSVTALVPAVYAYCEFLLTVFVNALLATLLSLVVIIYSLHIGYSAWYNTSFGVIYMLCLIDVYCTQTNIYPQGTHTHVTFHVALERPECPLATDSCFYGASPRLVSKRFPRAGANSWAHKGINHQLLHRQGGT
jgi:hypothetical protein